jgi:hypothetical protein
MTGCCQSVHHLDEPEQSLARIKIWTCASSLQHGELMVQDKVQQEVTATAAALTKEILLGGPSGMQLG